MGKFIKSRWVHIYQKKRRFALFNSKTLEIFLGDKEVIDLLLYFNKPHRIDEVLIFFKNNGNSKNLKKVINTLIKAEFIIPRNINELEELKKQVAGEVKNKKSELGFSLKLNALRVVLTEKCNMNCNYCFVQNKKIKPSAAMSLKTLIRGIDLLASLNKNSDIEVQFFGGEPLIKFNLIIEIIDYIRELIKKRIIKKVYYGITTNGTLLTDEIAQFLKKNNFLVSVSIDGWESLHDLNRHYSSSKGSFNDVLKGLHILQKNKNDIGVLITPAKNNIEFLAKACKYIITDLKCKFITINTPQPIKGNWKVDGKIFSQEIKKCFEIAKKHKAIINSFGTRVIYALNTKKSLIFSCSKFGNNYTSTLTPDGKISPCIVCWNYEDILTPIKRFCYKGRFLKWKLTMPYFFNKCVRCPAMNVCGGPCPLEIYELKKSSKLIAHERCKFFNDFLEWAILFEN